MKAIMRISFFAIFAIVIFGLTACESNNTDEKNTYTVVFNNNDGSDVQTLTVEANTTITEPDAPTKDGYNFLGWFSDSNYNNSYNFANPVVGNLNLYAKWAVIQYSITYDLDGGTNGFNPENYTIVTTTILLEEAIKEGYKFDGWFDNDEFVGDAVTEIVIGSTEDITLYAKWSYIQTYSLIILDFFGDELFNESYEYGADLSRFELPSAPDIEGYTFIGWDVEILNKMPAEDIVIHALYKNNFEILSEYFVENGEQQSNSYRININITELGNFNFYLKDSNLIELYRTTYSGSMTAVTKIMYSYNNLSKLVGFLQVQIGTDLLELTFSGVYDVDTNTFDITSSVISHSDWTTTKELLESTAIPSVEITMDVFSILLEQEIGIPLG